MSKPVECQGRGVEEKIAPETGFLNGFLANTLNKKLKKIEKNCQITF